MPDTPPRRFRFHECADRWLPTLQGYRTVLLVALGFGLAVPLVRRTLALADEWFVEALGPLAVLMSVLLLSYPVSKAASGLRDRWAGGSASGVDVPPEGEEEA